METKAKSIKVTSAKGTEYELTYDGLYRWVNKKGDAPAAISGGFTGPDSALMAFNVYNASLEFIAQKMSGEEELEALSTKRELLGYAEAHGIDIPEKYSKQPSSMKKFLQGGYA